MDYNDYLDLFLQESQEHLESMNQALLVLEQNPADQEAINQLFRDVHTVKGMAATMGFDALTELTHTMENVLQLLREEKVFMSPSLADLLFQSVDVLKELIDAILKGSNPEADIHSLIESIRAFEVDANQQPKPDNILNCNEFEEAVLWEAQKKNLNAYYITLGLQEGCVMKSVRAFMVYRNLEPLGEIIKSVPPVQDLEDENFGEQFSLLFISQHDRKTIEEAIDIISEIYIKEFTVIYQISQAAACIEEEINTQDWLPKQSPGNDLKTASTKATQTVRVDINKLDKLMNLVGELVINKSRLEQIAKTANSAAITETVVQLDRITSDLQNIVMNTRMVPIEQVFNRFPRMVRDLAKDLNKKINLIIEGKETELDRKVIDEIGDPLVHLLRNSIDHAIEPPDERVANGKPPEGMIHLIARQEGNSILILVQDDGRGINLEAVKSRAVQREIITSAEAEQMEPSSIMELIFRPGFSTADAITDISGRGVGLDVVRDKIQALNGSISVDTTAGLGTTFCIKLPLTLAIIQALLVEVGNEVYSIPLANIAETTCITREFIKQIQERDVVVLRGSVLPLIKLSEALEVPLTNGTSEELYVIVVKKDFTHIGLVVDNLIGLQEIVISSLNKLLGRIPGIAGAAVLGDGKVSLIIDVNTLIINEESFYGK